MAKADLVPGETRNWQGHRVAKVTRIVMSLRETTIALVKANNLHEGHWRLGVKFGPISGINAVFEGYPQPVPAAVVPVVELTLFHDEQAGPQTVDAAEVNPARLILSPHGAPASGIQ